ncbi:Isoamylase 3, chloroplastic [Chlamydiales bacterium STE3]|nr:Isoamylase 3, chloroplastic [Chlamydiales bacterium STE3]
MKISRGTPYPLGATSSEEGVNFAVFTDSEEEVTLCLYTSLENLSLELSIPYRTGKLRHVFIHNLEKQYKAFAYRIKYNEKTRAEFLSDPYAKALESPLNWHAVSAYKPLGLLQCSEIFEWENDKHPDHPIHDLVIYEMHVRSFTQHESSGAKNKGSFLGIIEKIPHLLELGVNAIELLPVCEFNESEYTLLNPETNQKLCQYWGYSTVNFFAPMNRYSASDKAGNVVNEFKTMVKALHENGIEVILDMVFNHTAEGNQFGPTYNFKGLANNIYYMLVGNEQYRNYSGCGNTLNTNHPIVKNLILQSLRYWVAEMHVDGFRFDLASIFYRDQNGAILPFPPIVDAITEDPILANTKLIAEPWDASGLYQVGSFYSESPRWSEWNGKYRDCVRKYIKGDKGLKGEFATRLSGSQDLYGARTPSSSVNFITCHDGFTLKDLVSYNQKVNFCNGEDNRDGTSDNHSWNCGAEGESKDKIVLNLREKQMKNYHLALMVSQGVPMLNMGDEYGHTRYGNNNAWCQDNELNWFLWDELAKRQGFFRFYKGLIHFRNNEPLLKRKLFLKEDHIVWHGLEPHKPEWDKDDGFVAFALLDEREGNDLFIAFNTSCHEHIVTFPEREDRKAWYWRANTALESPFDYYAEKEKKLETRQYFMPCFSSLILQAFK